MLSKQNQEVAGSIIESKRYGATNIITSIKKLSDI